MSLNISGNAQLINNQFVVTIPFQQFSVPVLHVDHIPLIDECKHDSDYELVETDTDDEPLVQCNYVNIEDDTEYEDDFESEFNTDDDEVIAHQENILTTSRRDVSSTIAEPSIKKSNVKRSCAFCGSISGHVTTRGCKKYKKFMSKKRATCYQCKKRVTTTKHNVQSCRKKYQRLSKKI